MTSMSDQSASNSDSASSPTRRIGARLRGAALHVGNMARNSAKRTFDEAITAIDPDVASHLINSSREMLLAARSFVDMELRMADRALDKVHRTAAERGKRTESSIITSSESGV